MKKLFLALAVLSSVMTSTAKTLVVYYSFTNDYAADNYAIGSALISAIRNNPEDASSYPAIDPVSVNLADYNCIIICAPLWWSNMAAPLQSFLFRYGKEMAGKNIGLIVSSASSGISGVESDARRLIPDGHFLSPSLWIRSSQTSNAKSLVASWLQAIDYKNIAAAIDGITADGSNRYTVYSLSGVRLHADAESTSALPSGIYIVNGRKVAISR